jgi:hypothetical protein
MAAPTSLLLWAIVMACKGDVASPSDETTTSTPTSTSDVGPEQIDFFITSPAPATWNMAETLAVTGMAPGLQNVTVNGVTATRDGDAWEATLPADVGTQAIVVTGIDDSGFPHTRRRSVLNGTFDDPEESSEAVFLRLNQNALDVIMAAIPDLLDAETIEAMLLEEPRIYADSIVWVYLEGIAYDTPRFEVTVDDEAMTVQLWLSNVDIDISYDGPGFLDGEGRINASSVAVEATLDLSVEDGAPHAEVVSSNVDIEGFYFDLDWSFGIEHLVQDEIEAAIITTLEGLMNTDVAPLISQTLDDFNPSYTSMILDAEVAVAATLDELALDSEGIELAFGIAVSAEHTEGDENPHPYEGYFYQPVTRPTLARDRDVAVHVSDNLLNRVLFAVWDATLLDAARSTADGSLSQIFIGLAGAREGEIVFAAPLPPVMVESDEAFIFQIGDYELDMYTPDAPLGDHVLLRAHATVAVSITVEHHTMLLNVGEMAVTLDAVENDWMIRPEEIEAMLVDAIELDMVEELATNVTVELPTYGNYTVVDPTILRSDDRVSTTITFDIGEP